MSYNDRISIDATADLSSLQYRAIGADGDVAASPSEAHGILQNKPESGQTAALVYQGRSKFRAGGAIGAGAQITVSASGWLTAAGSGDIVVGKNGPTAVTSGSVGEEGIFNFIAGTLLA